MFIIYWDKFDLHEAWSSILVGKIQWKNKFPLTTFFLSQSTWHEKKGRENMSDLSFTRMLHYFINIHLPFFFFPFTFLSRFFSSHFLFIQGHVADEGISVYDVLVSISTRAEVLKDQSLIK